MSENNIEKKRESRRKFKKLEGAGKSTIDNIDVMTSWKERPLVNVETEANQSTRRIPLCLSNRILKQIENR
jgi:hypothetical protein